MYLEAKLADRPAWHRFVLSTVIVALALGLTEALWLLVDRPISSPLFLGAIVVNGWFCGWRWGLFTAILSACAIDFFFVPPIYRFAGDFDEIARLAVFTIEGAGLCWLIEIRRRAVVETQKTQDELRALSSRQETLREAEQKRIALEIHDELGQALTGLKMEVHLLRRSVEAQGEHVSKPMVVEKLADLTEQIDSTMSTIRRIATEDPAFGTG